MKKMKQKRTKGRRTNLFAKKVSHSFPKDSSLMEDKHRQIVEGACKVFFRKGYHQTTIRDIIKSCNISTGQLYHYISSKDEVLYLVYKHMHSIWQKYLQTSEINNTDDPAKKFLSALRQSLVFMIENKELVRFIFTESKHLAKEHLKIILAMDNTYVIKFWENLLQEINEERPLSGDIAILGSLIPYLEIFIPTRGWTLKDKSSEEIIENIVNFIVRGIGLKQ